jgi:hypothetical protein
MVNKEMETKEKRKLMACCKLSTHIETLSTFFINERRKKEGKKKKWLKSESRSSKENTLEQL